MSKKQKTVRVEELIEFLQTCDPKAKVFITMGGSCNCNPVTFYEVDDCGIEVGEKHAGSVIIGEMTW